jgi:NAD(P)-dependent dehydrogenase (short-subunit alcohol dehydrogenase family)
MSWDIAKKTVLITGATSGIGLAASEQLARMGARLVLVGRDPDKLERAVARMKAAGAEASSLRCDFSSQASIRAMAQEAIATLPRIDALVNNAGGVSVRRTLTIDGIEATFATNHLGYFLLTNLLLERLVASAPARIVTVASIEHRKGKLDFDDLGHERDYSAMRAYRSSKLANVSFANALAQRLVGKNVTSNSLHPGSVRTNIMPLPSWLKPIVQAAITPFTISAEQGGQTIVQLVTDPSLENVSGAYFEKKRAVQPAPLARDEAVGDRLWKVSERLTGLS